MLLMHKVWQQEATSPTELLCTHSQGKLRTEDGRGVRSSLAWKRAEEQRKD